MLGSVPHVYAVLSPLQTDLWVISLHSQTPLAHLTVLDHFQEAPKKGSSVILLISLRWLARLGFFSQGAGYTFEQGISEAFNHPRGLSWLPMHVHPLALEDVMPGARVDLGKPLPCCQCGNQAFHWGLEVIKQNPSFHLKQILMAENLRLSGATSHLCKQLLGKTASVGGNKAAACFLTSTSSVLSFHSLWWKFPSCAPCRRGVPLSVPLRDRKEIQSQWAVGSGLLPTLSLSSFTCI